MMIQSESRIRKGLNLDRTRQQSEANRKFSGGKIVSHPDS